MTWVASVGNDCNQTCFNLGMRPVTVQKTKLLCSHSKEYTLAAPPGAVTSLTRYGGWCADACLGFCMCFSVGGRPVKGGRQHGWRAGWCWSVEYGELLG